MTPRFRQPWLLTVALATVSNLTVAATPASAPDQHNWTYQSTWGASAEYYRFEEKTAQSQGIDEEAFGVGIHYSGKPARHVNFTLGIAFLLIDDKNEFSQLVEDSTGDVESAESSIDAGTIRMDVGFRYPLNLSETWFMGLNGGYQYFDIDRTISNCTDCRSEEIDIDSSPYVKPFISYDFSTQFTMSLAATVFTDDNNIKEAVMLTFEF